MNNKLSPTAVFAIWINLAAVLVLLGLLFHAYHVEKPWLSYPNPVFPVLQKVVEPGQPVPLHVIRCNSDSTAHVYAIGRRLFNDTHPEEKPVILPGGYVPIDPGCTDETSHANVIPADQKDSLYHLEGLADIPGSLRSFNVPWKSEQFEVRKKTP